MADALLLMRRSLRTRVAVREMTERAQQLGADAIVGIDLDYEVLGAQSSMLMVNASGTAVKLS